MQMIPTRDDVGPLLSTSQYGTIAYTQLVVDLETPVSAMLKLGAEKPYSCLLESVEGGNQRGIGFSVIAVEPDLLWACDQNKAWRALPDGRMIGDADDDVFASLRQLIEESKLDIPEALPPMAAGLFGYFGYEMVSHIDQIPMSNAREIDEHMSTLMRASIVVVFDRLKDQMLICTTLA